MEYQRAQIKPEIQGDFGLLICRNTQTGSYRSFVTTPKEPLDVQRRGMSSLNLELVRSYEGIKGEKVNELYKQLSWQPSEEQIAGLDAVLLAQE